MVARVALSNMRQDRDEAIRSFSARLLGQAGICKYSIKCPTCNINVDYTDEMVRDALTRGISDHDIQLDLLGDSDEDMPLKEALKYIEAKEVGKRSASQLHDSISADCAQTAAASQYRKSPKCKKPQPQQHQKKGENCFIVVNPDMDSKRLSMNGKRYARPLDTVAQIAIATTTTRVSAKLRSKMLPRPSPQTPYLTGSVLVRLLLLLMSNTTSLTSTYPSPSLTSQVTICTQFTDQKGLSRNKLLLTQVARVA
ncbi:hypothetical protein Ahia01_000447200 [Argonauta hians]